MNDLAAQVALWIADDPDPATAQELSDLLEAWQGGDESAGEDLADRFSGLLQFGTAGLRGELGGGPHRMNRAVVIRAAAGLAVFLRKTVERPKVVIGYDARHGSHQFAVDSAGVLTAAGADVFLLPEPLPTPVLAFSVRHLHADAGIMVTASHNPPRDNGYKVYLGGRVVTDSGQGAQIVSPTDTAIATAIAGISSAAQVPRALSGWTTLGHDIVDNYVATALDVVTTASCHAEDLRVVLTAMHGVGAQVASRVLMDAGFTDLHLVPEQRDPDPDFPTVAFPNPEEPGALDLAIGMAERVNADVIIALDPDADRCAVAIPDPRSGVWRRLHGDETGALLGSMIADEISSGVLACSVVSSRLLGRIATAAGLGFATTLTGFKWISRTADLVFGYEEALGYCVDPAHVRDKDGITAALRVAALAARLKTDGSTIIDRLDALARTHGLHLTDQVSIRFEDLTQIPALVDRLRTRPPIALGGSAVTNTLDLAVGSPDLPPTDGIVLDCEDGSRVVVRPSGTEPKLKCYLEVVLPAKGNDLTEIRAQASERLAVLGADLRAALGF